MSDKIWFKSMDLCSYTCHQKASRSYFIKKYQMPICARCFGLTIGYLLALFIYNNNISLLVYIIMPIPLIIDGLIQLKTVYESTNFRRLITGIIAGIGYMSILIRAIIFLGGR